MGSRSDYQTMAAGAGFEALGYEEISNGVRRTWSICARRVGHALVTDREFRRFAFSRSTDNRDFLYSLPRLIAALRTGAMRYGIFTWRRPLSESSSSAAIRR
jgi:tocopherol O-methyltransferase